MTETTTTDYAALRTRITDTVTMTVTDGDVIVSAEGWAIISEAVDALRRLRQDRLASVPLPALVGRLDTVTVVRIDVAPAEDDDDR